MRNETFVLTTFADEVPMKIKGVFGEVAEQIYRPLIEVFG